MRAIRRRAVLAGAVVLFLTPGARAEQRGVDAGAVLAEPLTATSHPPLPRDPLALWLAPTETARPAATPSSALGAAVRLHAQARYEEALPLVRTPRPGTPLADYTEYYRGLTEMRLNRVDTARQTFAALLARPLTGYLAEAVRMRAAEAAEAQNDLRAAAALYAQLLESRTLATEDILLRFARVSHATGDGDAAAQAWARLYYEFPLSDQAALAQAQLDTLGLWQPLERGSRRFELELGRAERLFGSRRYAQARSAFEQLAPVAAGGDADLVALRIAETDYHLKRYRAALQGLEPWTRRGARRAEAQFFYLTATRELGDHAGYMRLARELVAAWPKESWAEETLNNLATHLIRADDNDGADAVFREILQRFPQSRHAERASWRAGWRDYKLGRLADTVRIFEGAAARFPRSDYRPMWLFWAARAHDRLGATDTATARYALVVTDYQNSYYGRLASRSLADRTGKAAAVRTAAAVPAADAVDRATLPANHEIVRLLIAHELYDDAMNELQYAQRVWGDAPAIQATIGLVHSRRGDLRRGINAMKRAYPQYMAAGGEELPVEMLKVLFPVDYWDLIRRHSAERGLDPYLIAALMAQESTFDAAIRSHANAVGLMQVLPSTGGRYARRIGMQRFSSAMLTRPEINVRLGTTIFADLVQRFGGTHLALASYNAGEGAVARWIAERPGVGRDEFIDDIPYPETQNYVKKILGTAEDYRRLYGDLGATTARPAVRSSVAPPITKAAPAAKTPPGTKATPARKPPAKKAPARKPPSRKATSRSRS